MLTTLRTCLAFLDPPTRRRWLGLIPLAGALGQPEVGLSMLAQALEFVEKNGERFYEAELYRLKGKLVLQSGVRKP